MAREDLLQLDVHALRDRMRAADLKQYWVADRIGVHRKTVSRWLSGQVTRIDRDNLRALAEVLDCEPETLLAPSPVLATPQEQAVAAALVQQRDLVQRLSPTDDWELAESLLRAVLRPDLPAAELGRLYNLLSIAEWRQSRYAEARAHAEQALDLGVRARDAPLRGKALANLATLSWFDEAYDDAEAGFADALEQGFDTARDKASALFNHGFLLRSRAEFDRSLDLQRRAVALFTTEARHFNLGIAWIGLALTWLDLGDLDRADDALDHVGGHADQCGWARGRLQLSIHRHEVAALRGTPTDPGPALEAMEALQELPGYPWDAHESVARIARIAGDHDTARDQLGRSGWPVPSFGAATELQERARLLEAAGEDGLPAWREASGWFADLGLARRVDEGPVREHGQLFGR